MTKYYKAVTMDYKDFYSGEIDYSVGSVVEHPAPGPVGDDEAEGYLSVTTDPSDVPGMADWPLRVLEVEIEDGWKAGGGFQNKWCTHKLTVVGELEPHLYFGPQGELVLKMAAQANTLSEKEENYLVSKLTALRGYSDYYQLRYTCLYSFNDRMSAYSVRKTLKSNRSDLYEFLEAVAVADLLSGQKEKFVWELVNVWDSFFTKTPLQLWWGRVKEFFTP